MLVPYSGNFEEPRRTSYRFAEGVPYAGLARFGDREVVAEILDESAEGFGISVEGTLDCQVGQTILVLTSAGWSEARIMNVRALQPMPADESAEPETACATRLGLLRIKDLPTVESEEDAVRSSVRSTIRSLAAPLKTLGGALVVTTVMIGGLVVVTAALVWAMGHQKPSAKTVTLSPPSIQAKPVEPRTKYVVREVASPPEPPRELPPATETQSLPGLPDVVAHLPRPEFLLKADVVRELTLSPQQQQQLQSMLDEQQAAAEPETNKDFGDRALGVLTDRQRETWQRLASRKSFLEKQDKQDGQDAQQGQEGQP